MSTATTEYANAHHRLATELFTATGSSVASPKAIGSAVARCIPTFFIACHNTSTGADDDPLEVLHSNLHLVPLNLSAWCMALCAKSLAAGEPMTESSTDKCGNDIHLTVVPIYGNSQCLIALHQSHSKLDVVAALQLAAVAMSGRHATEEQSATHAAAKHLAALCDLIARIEATDSRADATWVLAEHLAKYHGATHVFVAVADDSERLRVCAASHHDQIGQTAEETRVALAVMQEAVCRDGMSVYRTAKQNGTSLQPGLLCHKQYAEYQQHTAVVSSPLRDQNNTLRGAVLLAYADPPDDASMSFLAIAETPIATSFELLQRAEQNRPRRLLAGFVSKAKRQKLKATAITMAAAIAVSCVPIRYTVKATCELEPTNRRFIAAPFAGKLEACLVKPGDSVDAGQALAILDEKEIRWELNSVDAELQRAKNERAGHIAAHESGKAKLAQHDIVYLSAKSDLLTNRLSQLEIRSPIAGVVVSGDLTTSEGVLLEIGQALFEIAPLDGLVAEIAVPEDDVRFVPRNADVKFHLDAFPHSPHRTTIQQVHPRAEIIDDKNVFIAEASIENEHGQLRPGMKGTARIKTVRRPIIWILFHKPLAFAGRWLGV
ncbi:MAG: HlyD family efflux transporter periplasmic adaptor subunit [Planctomycetales bacterium]|nr:HlyD family efflux transporter periplasmic adaptor subunit [Planctomycetales bacterium]